MAEYLVRIGSKIGQCIAYMYLLLLEDVVYDFIYYLGFSFRRELERNTVLLFARQTLAGAGD